MKQEVKNERKYTKESVITRKEHKQVRTTIKEK